jgi:5-methylcytosine-specific restriction protein A
MLTAEKFRLVLHTWLKEAERTNRATVDINSGQLHRMVGGYPGVDHRMPVCCSVMEAEMRSGDAIVGAPPKGRGASLTIRYRLPR